MTQGSDRSVRAGTIIGSAITTGDNNTVTVSDVKVSLVDAGTVDLGQELASLRAVLTSLGAPDAGKIDRALQDAEEEAAKTDPKKDEIGAAIERAVTYAKGASEFGSHVEKLAPHLASLVSWLGGKWETILGVAGIAIAS